MVHRPDDEPLHFKPSKAGLYYYDATPVGLNYTNSSINAYSSFVTTVAQNLAALTPQQRRKIADAKRMYELIGRPSHARFLKMINEAQVDNCPVTTDDEDESDEDDSNEDETNYDDEEEEDDTDPAAEEEEDYDEEDEVEEDEEGSSDDSEEEIVFDPDDGQDDPLFDSYGEEGAPDHEEEGAPYGVRDSMVEQVETVEWPKSTDLLATPHSPIWSGQRIPDDPETSNTGGMPPRIRNRLRSSLSDRYLRRERTSDRALRRARRDRIQKGRGSKVKEVEGELVTDQVQIQDNDNDSPKPAHDTIDAPEPIDTRARDMDAMLAQLMEGKDAVSDETMAIQSKGWTSQLGRAVDYISKEFVQQEGRDTTAEGFGIHDNISQITNILLAQMSAKKGIKEFGERAVEAIIKEFDQLDKKKAFKPRKFQSLSVKERRDALRSITLVSEKRSGRIKGRTVADGRPQQKYKAPNQERVGDRDLEAKVSTYLCAENKNVTSEVAASEMVVTVPKQTKPRVTWATIVRGPKTAGRKPLSPSGQMFKLEKRRT
eukprot:scaffold1154_cov200-Cylindrotheca_fusiformis.AAC.5